ncbi:uncharacterized protein LOC141695687 [Apium graveolens]|uniref:uncharacterized protein LOC141695687 n=1 Tax=Apium graveolens TaxID=4045 RepID=UPI003D78B953
MSSNDGNEQRHLPLDNSVKINVDAAIFEDPRHYNYAFLTRDHNGSLVEAISKCSPGRVTPEFAEALGIREALSWTKMKRYHNMVVETDCLRVVQLIRSSFSSLSYLEKVIADCRTCLSDLSSQNAVLRFVRRSANSVAHYLARYSSSITDRVWRVGDVPRNLILFFVKI